MRNLMAQWWCDMFHKEKKPTRGAELLREAATREVRVRKVTKDLEDYRKRNSIAEQLNYIFDQKGRGRK